MMVKFSKDAAVLSDDSLQEVTGGFLKSSETDATVCPVCSGGIDTSSPKRVRYGGENITVYACKSCGRYFSKEQLNGTEGTDTDYSGYISE
ncbi:MAG: hypothetical protein J6F31_01385 [Oscillospiraceae bacterium]|nr:hypothetical protein [Oscillospiraceae bacterium]